MSAQHQPEAGLAVSWPRGSSTEIAFLLRRHRRHRCHRSALLATASCWSLSPSPSPFPFPFSFSLSHRPLPFPFPRRLADWPTGRLTDPRRSSVRPRLWGECLRGTFGIRARLPAPCRCRPASAVGQWAAGRRAAGRPAADGLVAGRLAAGHGLDQSERNRRAESQRRWRRVSCHAISSSSGRMSDQRSRPGVSDSRRLADAAAIGRLCLPVRG